MKRGIFVLIITLLLGGLLFINLFANCLVENKKTDFNFDSQVYEPIVLETIAETYNNSESLGTVYFSFVPGMSQLRSDEYVNEIIGLPYVSALNNNLFYSKHINSDTSEIMYIIYCGRIIKSFWYTSRWFNKSDFEFVSEGTSYEDVLNIDSSTKFKMMYDYYQKTYHLCESGYIEIVWTTNKNDPKVESITYIEDETIGFLYAKEKGNV